jgi:thymidylate kinase
MMIAFEGPDMCGKTQISQELALRLGLSYYKNSGEWSGDIKTTDYFKNFVTYATTAQTDLLCQIRPKVVLDRYYPSEWVYSRVFNRPTNQVVLDRVDEMFSNAGGSIILCRRKSYEGLSDDRYDYIDSAFLKKLDESYEEFAKWTKCQIMTLWVDDQNLERQIIEIFQWLSERRKNQ